MEKRDGERLRMSMKMEAENESKARVCVCLSQVQFECWGAMYLSVLRTLVFDK